MYCPKCGAENPEEAKFCGSCAAKLPTSTELAASPLTAPAAPSSEPASQAPPTHATVGPAPRSPGSPAPSGWGQPDAPPASHWGQPPGRQPRAWGQPGAAAAAATAGGVSTALIVGVIIATLIFFPIGLVMGVLYMIDPDPAKKSAGRIWLALAIVWGILIVIAASSV